MSRPIQQSTESSRLKQMRLNKLMQPGWGDVAYYIFERGNEYEMAKLMILVVVKLQMENIAAMPVPTRFGALRETLLIISAKSQMPQGSFQLGSRYMRLSSGKPKPQKYFGYLLHNTTPNFSTTKKLKPVEHVCCYRCKLSLEVHTI